MSKFGQYQLLERVAVGGMGEVYRARSLGEEGFEKPVAIKRILPSYASDVRFVEMLVTEARIHAALSHRNIVQIHDLGISEDHEYFIVLEFVDGHDLGALLTRLAERRLRGIGPSRVPDAVALYIAVELGEGLHFAHEMRDEHGETLGLVHRDISPSNVLLSYAGEVKLSDFGLAKRRTDHSIVGSLKGQLAYMSPEQARRAPLDRRTDVFSLGAVLFEMLTGQPLRTIADDISGWQQVASGSVPTARQYRPEILPALEQLLDGALAPDPRDRFPDARAFVAEARGALDLLPRSRAGEAGELTSLLRGLLPPGRPRPAKAQSKVIRLLSELAVPPPPPPPPVRKRESGLSKLSPPPAASPAPIAASAPAPREAPPAREESRPGSGRNGLPGPAGAERDSGRAAVPAPAPPDGRPGAANLSGAQGKRSDENWSALLDLVAPPIGSPGGSSVTPTPPSRPTQSAPSFRTVAPMPPLFPEEPAAPEDSEPLSSMEEIEGLEAPRRPARAPMPMPQMAAAPVPHRLPMPPVQPHRAPAPARETPPMPQMAPTPPRRRETPPMPQMAIAPQRMPPPQREAAMPQMSPAPQRMPPPQREAAPPPQMMPVPQRAPQPPREAPPLPQMSPAPQRMPPPQREMAPLPQMLPPQMMPPQMQQPPQMQPPQQMQPQQMQPQQMQPQHMQPQHMQQGHLPQTLQPQHMQPQHMQPQQMMPPPQMMPQQMMPQHMQPQHMPQQMMPPQMQAHMMPPGMMQEEDEEGLEEEQEQDEDEDEMVTMDAVPGMQPMPMPPGHPGMAPGPDGMPAWNGHPEDLEEMEGELEEEEEDPRQAWTYAAQPPGMMPEGAPYVVEGAYGVGPVDAGGGRLRQLRIAGIALAVFGAAIAAVHFAVVPLNVLAVWRRPARLEVESTPSGAEVFIDGRRLSARTPTFTEVTRDTEPHIIELRLEGYRSERQRIFYSKQVRLGVSSPLTPAASPDVDATTPVPPPRARRAPDPSRGNSIP